MVSLALIGHLFHSLLYTLTTHYPTLAEGTFGMPVSGGSMSFHGAGGSPAGRPSGGAPPPGQPQRAMFRCTACGTFVVSMTNYRTRRIEVICVNCIRHNDPAFLSQYIHPYYYYQHVPPPHPLSRGAEPGHGSLFDYLDFPQNPSPFSYPQRHPRWVYELLAPYVFGFVAGGGARPMPQPAPPSAEAIEASNSNDGNGNGTSSVSNSGEATEAENEDQSDHGSVVPSSPSVAPSSSSSASTIRSSSSSTSTVRSFTAPTWAPPSESTVRSSTRSSASSTASYHAPAPPSPAPPAPAPAAPTPPSPTPSVTVPPAPRTRSSTSSTHSSASSTIYNPAPAYSVEDPNDPDYLDALKVPREFNDLHVGGSAGPSRDRLGAREVARWQEAYGPDSAAARRAYSSSTASRDDDVEWRHSRQSRGGSAPRSSIAPSVASSKSSHRSRTSHHGSDAASAAGSTSASRTARHSQHGRSDSRDAGPITPGNWPIPLGYEPSGAPSVARSSVAGSAASVASTARRPPSIRVIPDTPSNAPSEASAPSSSGRRSRTSQAPSSTHSAPRSTGSGASWTRAQPEDTRSVASSSSSKGSRGSRNSASGSRGRGSGSGWREDDDVATVRGASPAPTDADSELMWAITQSNTLANKEPDYREIFHPSSSNRAPNAHASSSKLPSRAPSSVASSSTSSASRASTSSFHRELKALGEVNLDEIDWDQYGETWDEDDRLTDTGASEFGQGGGSVAGSSTTSDASTVRGSRASSSVSATGSVAGSVARSVAASVGSRNGSTRSRVAPSVAGSVRSNVAGSIANSYAGSAVGSVAGSSTASSTVTARSRGSSDAHPFGYPDSDGEWQEPEEPYALPPASETSDADSEAGPSEAQQYRDGYIAHRDMLNARRDELYGDWRNNPIWK
ncbi:uncharacterized protein LOC62_02G001933 [Vanrija pseudolonga]|uniref:Uncharacterized protein n=1 Tax=Vanrija pseudolonga TaxID=143232 RepID=A0AAF0Y5D7_9TREE|nr:hypothetical protein LOC62_02G001933 [Vanrija pseudolonga]